MRIIAGDYKGRKLETPRDYSIRPTTDKVKEALFSILSFRISDTRVLDLFSGTGNLGIEALSRGAKECVFVDNARDSINLIKYNVEHCKAQDYSQVIYGDFRRVLSTQTEGFDIILLDPPYYKGVLEECFQLIKQYNLLNNDGVIIAEHPKDVEIDVEYYGIKKTKEKKYGKIILSIWEDASDLEVDFNVDYDIEDGTI